MKPKLDGEIVFVSALGLFVLVILIATLQFPVMLRYTPFIVGGLTLLLLGVLLAGRFHPHILRWTESAMQDFWGGGSAGEGETFATAQETPTPWPAVLRVLAWVVGFLLSVYAFGFFAAPPVYVALYLVVEARVRPGIAIPIAIVSCGGTAWALSAVNVFLWPGIIPEIVPDYLGGAVPPVF